MPIGDVWQARVVTLLNNQTGINILHYLTTAEAGTGATAQQIATQIDSNLQTLYKNLLATIATYRGVGARRVKGIPTLEVPAIANAGVGNAGALPQATQIAGLISLRSSVPGRTGRGRFYVSFPAQADNTAGALPTAGYLTRLGLLGAQLILPTTAGAGGNTTTLTPCLLNRKTQAATTLVVQIPVSVWATQRRRGSAGRPNVSPF